MIKYYCIYDKQLNLANPPFAATDDQSAIRMVRNMLLSSDDTVLKRVLHICELRCVGAFEETASVFNSEGSPRVLCSLADIPLPDNSGGDT